MKFNFEKLSELFSIMPKISVLRVNNYKFNKNELKLISFFKQGNITEANVLIDKYNQEKNLHLIGDPIDRFAQIIIRNNDTFDILKEFSIIKDNYLLVKKLLSLYPSLDDAHFLKNNLDYGFQLNDTNLIVRKRVEDFIIKAMTNNLIKINENFLDLDFNKFISKESEELYERLIIKAKKMMLSDALKEVNMNKRIKL